METNRAVLFANGELKRLEWQPAFLKPSDTLIAVDGGLNHLEAFGLLPNLLIGDLDSVTPAQVERAQANGVEVRCYPPAKDETDLELALLAAKELGCNEIVVVAALGNRLDQTLGNLSLLLLPELRDRNVRFEDGSEEVFLIRDSAIISGQAGETVSLIPLWGDVSGVETENLQYPLRNETLYPEHSRGISNRLTADQAVVKIKSGILLCVHTHALAKQMEQK